MEKVALNRRQFLHSTAQAGLSLTLAAALSPLPRPFWPTTALSFPCQHPSPFQVVWISGRGMILKHIWQAAQARFGLLGAFSITSRTIVTSTTCLTL